MATIKIFKYIDSLDCFVVSPEYKAIAVTLGLTEWNEVVWIGRYFSLDNDSGEHWFDNDDLRDELEQKARAQGLDYADLLVIDPERFKNDHNGPCHSNAERRQFWTDVLKSLELSLDTIICEAVKFNNQRSKADEEFISDLENRITKIRNAYL